MKFTVSKTYSDVTPESAEHGDFDSTGFIFKKEELTFRELVEEMEGEGYFDAGGWLSKETFTVCYQEGRERTESLHVELPTARHKRYFSHALAIAGVR